MRLVVVHVVEVEHGLVEIDMPYKKAMTGHVGVPSALLAVLQQEEFRVDHCGYYVCLVVGDVGQGHVGGGVQYLEVNPAEGVALECGIIGRAAAVAVVGSLVHG